MAEKVIIRSITEELKQSYINYAMSVIVARALPDVRDGLKPVHRRILYVMSTLGLTYNRPFKKCATVVGQVLSTFHPHGDASLYDALVRMAQDFSLRYPLIDGQGNFGSVDGDRAAAYRYTEARMQRITDELLRDLGKETVSFTANYDDTKEEPVVLPSALPNLLLNGSTGIAVGMATNIPAHNLNEVVAALIAYIESSPPTAAEDETIGKPRTTAAPVIIPHHDLSTQELMQHVQAPDFPTGGIIHGIAGIKTAYETGRGSFILRGKLDLEPLEKGREMIVITEIPYQVNKAELIKKIAELVKNDVIRGPAELRDESDRHGMRVIIELKRDVNAQTVINLLYKHTTLEFNYNVNTVALVDGTPRTLGLRELIRYFYEHRFTVTTRRIQYDLRKARERMHIVEGFLEKALPHLDAIIKMIRGSSSTEAAKTGLIEQFDCSALQAQAILDLRLARLVRLEITKLEAERAELKAAITGYEELLAHPEQIDALLIRELSELKERYGDARRTAIVYAETEELNIEDFIHKDDVIVSLTHSGYIKRLPVSTYRNQGRGGMGVRGASVARAEDVLDHMLIASTHDWICFITHIGRAYYLRAHEINPASRTARGVHLKTFVGLGATERVSGMLRLASWESDTTFVIVTRRGKIKRTAVKSFLNAKRSGIRALTLQENDEVVEFLELDTTTHNELMLFTKKGQALRMKITSFREMGRTAAGVIGMRLRNDDEIIAVIKVPNQAAPSSQDDNALPYVLAVSQRGIGKRFAISDFLTKGRGGIGQRYMRVDEKTGDVAAVISVSAASDVIFTTVSGNVIRVKADSISLLGRNARGVRVVTLKADNDSVLDAAEADAALDSD